MKYSALLFIVSLITLGFFSSCNDDSPETTSRIDTVYVFSTDTIYVAGQDGEDGQDGQGLTVIESTETIMFDYTNSNPNEQTIILNDLDENNLLFVYNRSTVPIGGGQGKTIQLPYEGANETMSFSIDYGNNTVHLYADNAAITPLDQNESIIFKIVKYPN